MKTFYIAVVISTMIAAPFASGSAEKHKTFLNAVNTAFKQWDVIFSIKNPDYMRPAHEAMHSYLEDLGVRSKYYFLKSQFSLALMQQYTGQKVFLSGPHENNELNYTSEAAFGHYNPAFIKAVIKKLKPLLDNKKFRNMAQPVYNNYLQNLARQTYLAYHYYKVHPAKEQIKNTYLELIKNHEQCENYQCHPGYFLMNAFEDMSFNGEKTPGFNYFEANVMTGFWLRRDIDKTSDEFYQLLSLVLSSLDGSFR